MATEEVNEPEPPLADRLFLDLLGTDCTGLSTVPEVFVASVRSTLISGPAINALLYDNKDL